MPTPRLPHIALTLGDPAGIGPEIALAALRDAELRREMRIVAIGPTDLCPADVPPFDAHSHASTDAPVTWLASAAPAHWAVGVASAAGGRAALEALRAGHELALEGAVDALVTGPVSKEALHLAGEPVEGQTELLGRWCGVGDHQMLAVVGELRVLLLSRHLPLAEALKLVSEERVVAHLHLLQRALGELGIARPRLALAGLNPHAGEGGLLGGEELEVLVPATQRARSEGLDVSGPLSPDSVFLRAARGEFDGVLALYHDQAFIPVKLIGEGCALTVIAGLPYLRVSPAHGVAFDIAGKGTARPDDLLAALRQAAAWARARRARGQ